MEKTLRILIIKNNIKKINFSVGVDWLKKYMPFGISVEEISTSWPVKMSDELVGNDKYKNLCYVGGDLRDRIKEIVPENKYDCVCFLSDDDLGCIRPLGIAFTRQPLYPETDYIQVFKIKDKGQTFNHEMIHIILGRITRHGGLIEDPMDTYLNDSVLKVDDVVSTNREMALEIIKNNKDKVFAPVIQKRWKYFTLNEKTGSLGHTIADLDPSFVDICDIMRGECGFPWKFLSGYRTPEENSKVGGKQNSAHIHRIAGDIECNDDKKRRKIVSVAIKYNIPRIGIGKGFVHLDISKNLPQEVLWDYYD